MSYVNSPPQYDRPEPDSGALYTQPLEPPRIESPQPTASTRWRRLPAILEAIALLVIVAGFAYLAFVPRNVESALTNTSGQAIIKCQAAVADRLKAPGSAKYGDVKYTPESDIAGRVTGWVDAENGFGAMIRNRFVCTAYNPSGSWFIQDVTFSDW